MRTEVLTNLFVDIWILLNYLIIVLNYKLIIVDTKFNQMELPIIGIIRDK